MGGIEALTDAAPSRPVAYLYEDDAALGAEIVAAFAREGETVVPLANEAALRALAPLGPPAVLIMDRMIGDRDSLAVLESLRARGMRLPVIVVSSRAGVDDRIFGLKAGGDDYLVKPFALGELVARVAALRRRAEPRDAASLTVGSLTLDLIRRTARRDGREIALLPREFGLLEYLMRHAGQTVTRAMLLEDVWHYNLSTQTNVVDVHVGNLRRKLDAGGGERLIASVRGLGFRLDPD